MTFTESEIDQLYRGSTVVKPHEQETLAHRMIGIYQANEYAIELLKIDHKVFEAVIEKLVLEEMQLKIHGFSEERVDSDPRAAFTKLFMVLMNRWTSEFFVGAWER